MWIVTVFPNSQYLIVPFSWVARGLMKRPPKSRRSFLKICFIIRISTGCSMLFPRNFFRGYSLCLILGTLIWIWTTNLLFMSISASLHSISIWTPFRMPRTFRRQLRNICWNFFWSPRTSSGKSTSNFTWILFLWQIMKFETNSMEWIIVSLSPKTLSWCCMYVLDINW